jgi:hypothetical protein
MMTWVWRCSVLLAILATVGFSNQAVSQEPLHAAELNPWARFGIGSWKKVRAFSESLTDGKVETTSVKDTKTTLVEVTDTHYVLKVETTVEVAGKKFVADPKYLQQGYNGETNGQTVEIKKIGPGEVLIDGRKYPSEIRQVTVNGDELKRVSLVYVSESVSPFILRRETKATDAAGTTRSYDSFVDVVAVDMPFRVLSESKTVSHVRTVVRQVSGGSTVVMEVHCADVPGGVVAHSAKELNVAGRVVSRESLELTEYQVVPIEPATTASNGRRRIFQRTNRTRSGG